MLRDLVVVIDGNYMLHRVMNVPEFAQLQTSDGIYTGGIYGFLKTLGVVVHRYPARVIVVVWDGGLSTRRREVYPAYKERPTEIAEEVEVYRGHFRASQGYLADRLYAFGVRSFQLQGREGDDLVSLMCRLVASERVCIVSQDADLLQLINDRVCVYQPRDGGEVDLRGFEEHVGVPPEKYLLYRALIGDRSDNIVGIHGVGKVTAAKILKSMQGSSLEELAAVTQLSKAKVWQKVACELDVVRRNLKLIDLSQEIFSPEEVLAAQVVLQRIDLVDVLTILEMFRELQFHKLHKLPGWDALRMGIAHKMVAPNIADNYTLPVGADVVNLTDVYANIFPYVSRTLAVRRP